MQIIIDTCTLNKVFDPANEQHYNYVPIRVLLIEKRKATMPIGGNTYQNEIQKCIRLYNELRRARILKYYSDTDVDNYKLTIIDKIKNCNYDDPHIIALQVISKAEIICSCDKRAFNFFKMKELYPKKHKRAKIYSSLKNKNILK